MKLIDRVITQYIIRKKYKKTRNKTTYPFSLVNVPYKCVYLLLALCRNNGGYYSPVSYFWLITMVYGLPSLAVRDDNYETY
jgi:hypothetical protein